MKRAALGGRVASVARGSGSGLKALLLGTVGALTVASFAVAGPEGGTVVHGNATITTPTSTTTQIDQSSDKAVINWQSFNVGKDEKAIFNQPNAASVTLNRIFDKDPSIIAGLVSANGRLVLINANGMVFENGATVNTAGLIATTADISNSNFMAGDYRFETPGNPQAQIVNKGTITAEQGGVVAFVAPSVKNQGVITAKLGRVALGAGKTFVLDLYGDELISFPISAEIAEQLIDADGKPLSSLVDVSGKIDAGQVQLTARAARGLIDNVINVDGEIIASGAMQAPGGVAFTGEMRDGRAIGGATGAEATAGRSYGRYGDAIVIDGGANGVRVAGRLDASGAQGGSVSIKGETVALRGTIAATGSSGKGGDITVGGRHISLVDAKLDASGATGGGSIAVGHSGAGANRLINADTVYVSQGSSLKADATDAGNGGSVVFWSNLATDFRGTMSARGGATGGNGGFLEVSSKEQIGFWGTADASAAAGKDGLLLLDPKNIIISVLGLPLAGLTDPNQLVFAYQQGQTLTVNPAFLTTSLNLGTNVRLQANNDLTVDSDIIVNRNFGDGGDLTLQAGRSIFLNADIFTDNGSLTLIANELLSAGVVDAERDPGAAVITMAAGASIDAGTGLVRITLASGAGKTHTTSGDITLRDITADRIIAENLGPSNGDVVIASGTLTGTRTGSAIILASQGGDFVNNAGAGALSVPNGRFLVYSQSPLSSTLGGLAGSPYYNTTYDPANPTAFPADGDRFAYTLAPVLTVKADDMSREYGNFNPDLTYTITGFIAGDDPALALEGFPFLSTIATNTSNAGTYAINVGLQTLQSDYNYGISLVAGTLNVIPAQLFYNALGAIREYGEANPDFGGDVSGFRLNDDFDDVLAGTLVFLSPASPGANVGQHAINGTGLTVVNSNYQPVILQDPGNATALTITQAQLTYVANAVTREYGDANVLSGVVEGLKNGETLESVTDGVLTWTTSATVLSGQGIYEVLGGGLTVTSGNYFVNILQAPANLTALTITPAQLIYRADSKTKRYGDANPIFTGSILGLKNGDTLDGVTDGTAVWVSNGLDFSDAGAYGIFGEGLTVTSGNYFVDIIQADTNETAFTVERVQLTYVADKKVRIYGFPDPVFTGVVEGLTNGDSIENVTDGDLVFTVTTTPTTLGGIYPITGGGLTVVSDNYFLNILQDPGNATAFQIVPLPVTILQAMDEVSNGGQSTTHQPQNDMSSRSNDLAVEGTVSGDMADGKNDKMTEQLCALGAREVGPEQGCSAKKP